ncbi:MAG: SRPBCC family protein [Candidatus Sulfotelmatobacter sp.]
MVYLLEFADWVPVPVPQVFAFFSNPENLPRLMPPSTGTKVEGYQLVPPPPSNGQDPLLIRKAAGKGSIIDTSFRPLSFLSWRRKWTSAITEFEWNHHFVDAQQKGPFKRWHHRHEFLPDSRNGFDGTLVRDIIEYEVGFGPLGGLANSLFIDPQMRRIFAHRQKVLPELLS